MKRLPDSPSQTNRRYAMWRVPAVLFDYVLVIRVKRSRDVYAVAEESSEGKRVRAFLLEKINRPRPEFGPYLVVVPLAPGEVGDCSCQGFGRWGACKHWDCLSDFAEGDKDIAPK